MKDSRLRETFVLSLRLVLGTRHLLYQQNYSNTTRHWRWSYCGTMCNIYILTKSQIAVILLAISLIVISLKLYILWFIYLLYKVAKCAVIYPVILWSSIRYQQHLPYGEIVEIVFSNICHLGRERAVCCSWNILDIFIKCNNFWQLLS